MKDRVFPGPFQFVVLGLGGTAVVLAPIVRNLLPDRFLLDDQHLQNAIEDPGFAPEDGSFHVLAQFYTTLGLESSPLLAATASIMVLVFCLLLALDFHAWDRAGILGAGLLSLSLGLGLAYLAQFTKEFVSLIVVLVVLSALRLSSNIWRAVIIVGVCLTYGALVRPYWALIAALIPCAYFILRRTRNPLLILVAVVVAFVGLAIAFQVFRSESLGATREWVNSGRTSSPVATMIENPDFGSSPVGGLASILVVAVFLLVPVPLLTMGSTYYLVAAGAITVLWAVVATAIIGGRAIRDSRVAWIASVLTSLFVVLVIFEPDYGSYLKHLSPFLPLFVALVPLRKGHSPDRDQKHGIARSQHQSTAGDIDVLNAAPRAAQTHSKGLLR